ncbi:MAG: hypothetical protein WCP60_01785 [bacterium]
MSMKFCSSCGRGSDTEKSYCIDCGGVLMADKNADGGRLSSSEKSGRIKKNQFSGDAFSKPHFVLRFLRFLFLLLILAFIGSVVLAVMKPKDDFPLPPPSAPVANPAALVDRALNRARFGQSGIPLSVINALLLAKVHFQWTIPYEKIPLPVWKGARVILGEGEVWYHFEITFMDHPIYFTEIFRLAGSPRQWDLEPISGNIGLLPFQGSFLKILTPLVANTISPVSHELHEISLSDTIKIHPGMVEFSGH